MKLPLIIFISLVIFTLGCATSIFNTEPFIDSYRDDQDNVIIADTPRMWSDFIYISGLTIESELSGRPPSGGIYEKWEDFWISYFQKQMVARENPERYINNIILRRREKSLPEVRWQEP